MKLNYNTLGIDIGSTTVKIAILNTNGEIIFSDYQRHYANIQETLASIITDACEQLGDLPVSPMITGSGGLTLSKHLDIPFVQEVVAVATSLKDYAPQTDVAIELGGEDAKIIYFTGGIDQRMNGICAGGTGSFIDQMATLLKTDASGLNEYAKNYEAIYPIAARCGVFAKSDIQPLINEGATKEDLAASIFQAVVNQTISGLACGKPIRGNVAFLGGPLHFLTQLRQAFIETLHLTDDEIIAPEHSHLFAASGAAMNAKEDHQTSLGNLKQKLAEGIQMEIEVTRMPPLFNNEEEYREFIEEHSKKDVPKGDFASYKGNQLPDDVLKQAKKDGFADKYISKLLDVEEKEIRNQRLAMGMHQVWEPVHVSSTKDSSYYYSTYNGKDQDEVSNNKKIMILGGGPNRIGQGIEFDYCCVHASLALKKLGFETIIVNCNPETVSTDYDTSDKLYFEPLTLEDVLSIHEKEKPLGVIAQFGGQTPLNLASQLKENGVNILGTTPETIDMAEDRDLFNEMMEKLEIPMPESGMAVTIDDALEIAQRIGYPLMVRPSYVLGGRGMEVVYDDDSLKQYMAAAVGVTPDRPILIDRFLNDAMECEADAISDGENVFGTY